MSDNNNSGDNIKNNNRVEDHLNQASQSKQDQQTFEDSKQSPQAAQNDSIRNTVNQSFEQLKNVKMNDLLDFGESNELNVDGNQQKLDEFNEKKRKEKEQLRQLQDKLMRETINLNLEDLKKKEKKNTNQNQRVLSNTSEGSTDGAQINQQSATDSSALLYKKLEQKWGLTDIKETEEEKSFMNSLLTKTEPQQGTTTNTNVVSEISEAEARNRIINQYQYNTQHKRKNITEFHSRYSHEIDPMMQGSHLDLKNEEAPKVMRYMDEFREFRPQINIGERWGQIIQQSAINRIQYEQQIAKGGNLVSYMARTGKLGIDLYFILFGLSAAFILPYAIYRHQKQKTNYIQKTKNINPKTVPDFYYSEYDLDEISVQKSFYNQYTEEIMKEKNKKLKMHKEINSLTDMLFANK